MLNGDLQRALAPHGLFWPPDPASADICTIGGNLACNAGGPRAVKYGASRDNVLGLARRHRRRRTDPHAAARTTKDATGYDLTHLLVGSEGTLALIVEATLKLTPLPAHRASLRALLCATSQRRRGGGAHHGAAGGAVRCWNSWTRACIARSRAKSAARDIRTPARC